MHSHIRFYLDENIQSAVALGLRIRGIDVLTAQEAGLRGASDQEHLAFATANERVLVTYDTDFLVIDASGQEHTGIAWCHSTKYSLGALILALVYVHSIITPEEMRNHIEYL